MGYTNLDPRDGTTDLPMSNGASGGGAVEFLCGSSIAEVEVVGKPSGVALREEIVGSSVDSGRKRKKLQKVEATEEETAMVEGEKVDEDPQSQTTDELDFAGTETSEIIDNVVLRKCLRGPRYFDPADSGWGTCFSCGEEEHQAVNCTADRHKKPCSVCGDLDHNAKQCPKGQDGFICKKGGHRAKDCPESGKSGSEIPRICLKCGHHGHDMFSCENDYSLEDLKDIQCYVCQKFGHLCCFNTIGTDPTEPSCYKCGQLGHTGLACSRFRGKATDAGSPSSWYMCGEEEHFARECPDSSKVEFRRLCRGVGKKGRHDPSTSRTPTGEFRRHGKDNKSRWSLPNDIGTSPKKNKIQFEDKGLTTPWKSKHRGGWMAEHFEDYSSIKIRENEWQSYAPPSMRSTGWTGSHPFTFSQSASGWKFHSITQVPYESPTGYHNHYYLSQRRANDFLRRNFVEHQLPGVPHNRYSVPRWSGHGDYYSNGPPTNWFPASRFDHNTNRRRSNYSWW